MKEFLKIFISSLIVVILMAIFASVFREPNVYHYVSLLLIILVFYYLVISLLRWFLKYSSKKLKKIYPQIGILNGNIVDSIREYKCQRSWTNVTTSMWLSELQNALKNVRLKKIKTIPTVKISNTFSIIINPFGDSFPEEDLKLHKTFYQICEYIKDGGLFVCTGGSFWSHQNPKLSDSPEWVFVKTRDDVQSLKESFLYYEFGIETTGDEYKGRSMTSREPIEVEIYQKEEDKVLTGEFLKGITKIKRFRSISNNSSDYIPLVREIDDKTFPIAMVRYGNGYLIHIGMHLESVQSLEFKLIIQIIKFLITNKFNNLI